MPPVKFNRQNAHSKRKDGLLNKSPNTSGDLPPPQDPPIPQVRHFSCQARGVGDAP